ncbi:MAG: Zn-dependent hydrolase [Deltaproteobacteria bacterium]|nr:Zn-dependent hydrolase [Deltaproteobacteria bacterium]
MHRYLLGLAIVLAACSPTPEGESPTTTTPHEVAAEKAVPKGTYTSVRLEADLSGLSDDQREMVRLFIAAADQMDDAFWIQAYGDQATLLAGLDDDQRRFAEINYGPWDRLDGDASFVDGIGPKPLGANLYPADASQEEIDQAAQANPQLKGLYTMVRRGDDGSLAAIPYHEFFSETYNAAADSLEKAAALAVEPGLKKYLGLRAEALRTSDYLASDMAWMDMKDNQLDVVIGPIETYEDKLFGAKAASEAYVLVKDLEWSGRLARYAQLLPSLQEGLPVPDAYKQETPGSDADLGAYEVVYYAGDCNAGSKTIAINLPNDEQVQLEKGTRRLQLKNAMRAKFDRILLPISQQLIDPEQRKHITFDAFFANTMFHEVAHGLGIKNTLNGAGTVREALGAHASKLEEGKADVLGLYMITSLADQGELGQVDLGDNFVTFMTSIFRSIRFGASSAHGVANLIRFNFFAEHGAFSRDEATRTYRVDFDAMNTAANALSAKILTLQGDGDADAAEAFISQYGVIGDQLQADLDSLGEAGIPVDVVFEQGLDVLGL